MKVMVVDDKKGLLSQVIVLILRSDEYMAKMKVDRVSYDDALETFIFGDYDRVLICEGYEDRDGEVREMSAEVATDVRNSASDDVKVLRLGFGDDFDIKLIASIDEILEELR